MLEPINVLIQWPHRKESGERCAEKLSATIDILEAYSSIFASWAAMPRTLAQRQSCKPIDHTDKKILLDLLLKGQSKTDAPPRAIISELGFSAQLWNLNEGDTYASITVFCGSYAKNVPYNSVSISIRRFYPPLLTSSDLIMIMKKLLFIWEANFGSVFFERGQLSQDGLRIDLAHFSVPGTDFSSYWPKIGTITDTYLGGELRVDERSRIMFDSGEFVPQNSNRSLIAKLLNKVIPANLKGLWN
jgi:hypothetical protein